jgi:hypothetical protein
MAGANDRRNSLKQAPRPSGQTSKQSATYKKTVKLPRPVVLPDLRNEAVYRKLLKEAEADVRASRKSRARSILQHIFSSLH